MSTDGHGDFLTVLRDGYGVEPGGDVELAFVNTAGGDTFSSALRVGMLARLLSNGVDWEEAATATMFTLEVRSSTGSSGGLRVEFGEFGSVPLDVFAVAEDPIAAVLQMVQDAGGSSI
jgi:hypothetical protein